MHREGTEKCVCRPIGQKTAAWFPETNKYVLADPPVVEAARAVAAGEDQKDVIDRCMQTLGLSRSEAARICNAARELIAGPPDEGAGPDREAIDGFSSERSDTAFFSEKFYNLSGVVLRVAFSSGQAQFAIHPRFAHLETGPVALPDHHFEVHHHRNCYAIRAEGRPAGMWPEEEEHVFVGQFCMRVLEIVYGKTDGEWMAVLHAAGVSDGENCLLFAGKSGAGKSTLAALLLSRGFDILADDFLPLESATGMACRFPGAVSIKKDALGLLAPRFPELRQTRTYHLPGTGKTVRYLSAGAPGRPANDSVPCRALVFVNYRPGSGFCLEDMAPEEAFARLVPDSWIYPSRENARRFLEWFSPLPCYRLVYGDNKKMVQELELLLTKTA